MLWALAIVVLGAGGGALDQARVQEDQGQPLAALATLEQAVAADPRWVLARLELGRLALAQGVKTEAALHHLDVARSLSPENPRAHYLFALAADEQGLRGQARRALEVALLLRPDYGDAGYRLAGLLVGEGRFADAAALLSRYLATHPEATGARSQLASALERAGDLKGAERELRELLKVPGQRLLAGRRLADLLERSGRKAEAAKLRASLEPPRRQLRELKPSRR